LISVELFISKLILITSCWSFDVRMSNWLWWSKVECQILWRWWGILCELIGTGFVVEKEKG